jgi:glycosyltransferase involved in cell wall biosynthesis
MNVGRDPLPPGFAEPGQFVIGTVGRMQPIKDPVTLARAFVRLLRIFPDGERRLRLVMVGDGPLRDEVRRIIEMAGATATVWFPGKRDDVPRIMRSFDLFVLPSVSEGISNTILEAMASGLPVLATRVGGNPELVKDGVTGTLIPPSDEEYLARAMGTYAQNHELCRLHGREGRVWVESRFSIDAMVDEYTATYDKLLAGVGRSHRGIRCRAAAE